MTTDRLRIAMVAPPWYPVPPDGYGGIEALVADLVSGLVDRGHDVLLIGAGKQGAPGHYLATFEEPPTERIGEGMPEVMHTARAARHLRDLTVNEPAEHEYFDAQVRPRLGPDIEHLGEADNDIKRELLSTARCVLFPIQWEEPFGLVMIEAMACGTPVVALRRGAVPEVVVDGVTGLVRSEVDELPAAIEDAGRLSPADCREHVERNFDIPVMTSRYERVYRSVLERH